jgi:shikimate dehydrogenase
MQNAALRTVGLANWHYGLLPVPPERFAETVHALSDAGFRGANVTIPHKAAAHAVADVVSERARCTGVANTLCFEPDGAIRADNTDAPALIAALPFDPSGRTALVLGAGGTGRSAVWSLREAGAEVRVWNRTPARAVQLAEEFGAEAIEEVCAADLLVHCTSSGLAETGQMFKGLPVTADDLPMFGCVVDYVYRRSGDTELITAARSRSIAVVDGIDLLVGQGALSFEQFTGHQAPVQAMRAAVRE